MKLLLGAAAPASAYLAIALIAGLELIWAREAAADDDLPAYLLWYAAAAFTAALLFGRVRRFVATMADAAEGEGFP